MNDNKLLSQIANGLRTVKEKLGSVESNIKSLDSHVESLDNRVVSLDNKVGLLDKKIDLLDRKIDRTQEETISVLSELIHEGYNSHEKRIKAIEEQLQTTQPQ